MCGRSARRRARRPDAPAGNPAWHGRCEGDRVSAAGDGAGATAPRPAEGDAVPGVRKELQAMPEVRSPPVSPPVGAAPSR
jgi:hypothetical protein